MKNAIVVLTRGYNNVKQYKTLILRNQKLSKALYRPCKHPEKWDIIIFHEGNISPPHQQFIQRRSPLMPLQFRRINFLQLPPVNCPQCPNTDLSNRFGNGYKNMCYFWSIRFLRCLSEYNYIIRVDEDCYIDQFSPELVDTYESENIVYATPRFQEKDFQEVTLGLESMFQTYLQEKNLTPIQPATRFPYTNLMVMKLPYFLQNPLILGILQRIERSHCIFSNRWGDLPIWGYILNYLVDPSLVTEETSIVYYHGSHEVKVNE